MVHQRADGTLRNGGSRWAHDDVSPVVAGRAYWHADLMPQALGTQWFEVADHPELPTIFGDWVVREQSGSAARIADYARVLTEQTGKTVRFERREQTRPCLIWHRSGDRPPDRAAPNAIWKSYDDMFFFSLIVTAAEVPDWRTEGFSQADTVEQTQYLQGWPAIAGLPLLVENVGHRG